METKDIDTDELKYDILDALRDLYIRTDGDVDYEAQIRSLIYKLRKCKILIEVK